MFKEILKIIPRLEAAELNKMERTLGQRFGRVAKKFGKGLLNAIKGGGALGLAVGLIDKFLNPLKEVQDSIERTLARGDDLVTFAKQFNTTAGRLAKLEAFGKSAGLDRDDLFQALTKFQVSVAEASADPTKQTSVRAFANRTDTADAFFEFIQSLQKLSANDQIRVQQEVFGEKQILKMADFLSSDFALLNQKYFKRFSSNDLTKAAERTGNLSDTRDALTAVRDLDDMMKKSNVINENMITAEDRRLREELTRENERIKSYETLSTISEASTKILGFVERGIVILTDMLTKLTGITEVIKKIAPARLFKNIGSLFGGGD